MTSPSRRCGSLLAPAGRRAFSAAALWTALLLVPSPAHAETLVVEVGRLETADGTTEGPLWIVLRDGAVEGVRPAGDEGGLPAGARRVVVKEGWAVPAFVDAAFQLEVERENAPAVEGERRGEREVDEGARWGMDPDDRNGVHPEASALDALARAEGPREHRRQGFGCALVLPPGRGLRGRAAFVRLGDRPLAARTLLDEVGFDLNLAPPGDGYPSTLMGLLARVRQFLSDARWNRDAWSRYERRGRRGPRPRVDRGWRAVDPLLDKERPLLVHAESAREIGLALDFAREQDFRVVLVGGRECERALERLAAARVGVILTLDYPDAPKKDEELPERVRRDREERRKSAVEAAARLHEKGIPFAFGGADCDGPKQMRERIKEAIDAGLPREAALAALTRFAARLVGLEGVVGEVKEGAVAQVAVFDGDPLDPKSQVVRLISGDEVFEFRPKKKEGEGKKGEKGAEGELPDVSGKWRVTVVLDSGERSYDLELEQDGADLSGYARSQAGGGDVTGSVGGDGSVRFSWTLDFGDRSYTFEFDGRLEGDRIVGKATINGGNESRFRARRPDAAGHAAGKEVSR